MIVHIENPKELTQKTIRANKGVQQGFRIQDKYTKLVAFLYTHKEKSEI